ASSVAVSSEAAILSATSAPVECQSSYPASSTICSESLLQLWKTRPLRKYVPTATTHQLRITVCARTTSQPGQPEEERNHAHRTRELRRDFSSTSRCTSNGGYVSSQWPFLRYTFLLRSIAFLCQCTFCIQNQFRMLV